MARHSFWSGLVVIVIALLALNWIIPGYAGSNPFAQIPPDLVPRLASWLMLICGLCIVTGAVYDMVRQRIPLFNSNIDWPALAWASWPFAYVALATWVLVYVKITYVGPLIIALLLYLLGERRWYILVGCSIVPVAMLYVLSVYMMRVGVV
ncbi:MAG: hypothetical protein LAT65_03505 [Saccharospirillum sp.]|nr:hypothetical protein [Saccharospirillum sp.]